MYKIIILFLTILTLISCNSSKSVIITTKTKKSQSTPKRVVTIPNSQKKGITSNVTNNYIIQYKDIAMQNMKNFGIPASIILAQGILESGSGKSNLALKANNHFGIKCYKDWAGDTAYQDDDSSQECFRKYKNPEESYQDHADILSKRSRYATLFNLPKGDYKAWAKGLKAAGYATDPNYPEKLINYIEQNHLDQYDNQVFGKDYVLDKNINVLPKNNQYEVQEGDTLYSISKKFNISIEDLKKQNDIFDNTISIGQTLIIN